MRKRILAGALASLFFLSGAALDGAINRAHAKDSTPAVLTPSLYACRIEPSDTPTGYEMLYYPPEVPRSRFAAGFDVPCPTQDADAVDNAIPMRVDCDSQFIFCDDEGA